MNCVDINSGSPLDMDERSVTERDPVTGLSAKDRQAIRCSWTLVSQDLQTHGINFMIRFFEDYPDNQDSFVDFRDVSLPELRHHPGLQLHAMRVMRALTAIVDSIDESHVLIGVVHKTVDSHLTRGINYTQFTDLLEVFGRFLGDSLGSQFTADMASAWHTAVTAILAVVQARMEDPLIQPPDTHTTTTTTS